MLKSNNYNPDVLSCLANLSNDEVFTPPQVANLILDLLPESIWSNKDIKFLDPVSKSGIFLREIAKRLMSGLEKAIPDIQERANHIYTNQVFGIAITELTSLLSKRTVYCSKTANGPYSICDAFNNQDGNIRYKLTEHTWKNGKCKFCGANEGVYERSNDLETHAYEFIHTDKPKEILDMKFDVIVGNPPYQLNDGGGMGTSATPIYQDFIAQAKKMNPRYLTMIIPSRWFSGGKGLDDFRNEMLNDKRLRKVVDYFDSNECFPGVDISGGICYFLWESEETGECEVVSMRHGSQSTMVRPLLEKDCGSFIRFNEAVKIVRKIKAFNEPSIEEIISSRRPFGLDSQVKVKDKPSGEDIKIYSYPNNGYINKDKIEKNQNWVNKYKVYISKAYGERGNFPYLVLAKPFLGEKKSCCSETYLVVGPFDTQKECKNAISYIRTKFFRFLVLLKKNTQNSPKGVYSYVPMQDFGENWTDEKLYEKYSLTKKEIDFVESMIRPMELNNG